MQAIQTMANEVLVNVALGVITLLGAYAAYYIRVGINMAKARTSQIEGDSTRKLLNDALTDVENLAFKSVSATEQTMAKTLREAVRLGNSDREKLLALGRQTFLEVKAAITPDTQAIITKNLGNFDDYLTKCIEDAVRRVKLEDPYFTLEGELLSSGSQ